MFVFHYFLVLLLVYPFQKSCHANKIGSNDILKELPWSTKVKVLKALSEEISKKNDHRKLLIQAYTFTNEKIERADQKKDVKLSDEEEMKTKLFRLMHSTIKDIDMKIKRTEVTTKFYKDNIAYEIGSLMGDVMDKKAVMWDIGTTMQRFISSWESIALVSACEQVAQLAVEAGHLIDIIKVLYHRNNTA